jgi:hypothetical protein
MAMGYPKFSSDDENEARAIAAEDELTAIRKGVRELQAWLKEPVRGTVIFRSEVVELLDQILAQ